MSRLLPERQSGRQGHKAQMLLAGAQSSAKRVMREESEGPIEPMSRGESVLRGDSGDGDDNEVILIT